MILECYQCGKLVHELSLRSRCVGCEHQRGDFNEAEIERLREAAYEVVNKQSKYTIPGKRKRAGTVANAIDELKKVLET
jgi:hypothetical protein